MCSAMAMILVRGEAPLQPFVFAKQYALIIPSSILTVSALALLFESIPFLSGRFGDVAYFFLWTILLGFSANAIEHGGSPQIFGVFDVSGLGYLMWSTTAHLHTKSMAIGSSIGIARSSLCPSPE